MSEDILLSDRERAEGFLGYWYCGAVERERAEGFLGYVLVLTHNNQSGKLKSAYLN